MFGAADRLYVLFGVSYETLLSVFRIAIWVVPPILFVLARRLCRELQHADRIEAEQERAIREAVREEARTRAEGRSPVAEMPTAVRAGDEPAT